MWRYHYCLFLSTCFDRRLKIVKNHAVIFSGQKASDTPINYIQTGLFFSFLSLKPKWYSYLVWKWMLLQQSYFFTRNWKCGTDSSQFHQKQEHSNFVKHASRDVVAYIVPWCSSTNQIKGIESFVPTLPDSKGLLNKQLRKPWPMKLM